MREPEPFFNEISVEPLCETDQEIESRIKTFVAVLKFCGGFLGFKKVRSNKPAKDLELKKDFSLKDYLAKNAYGNNFGAQMFLSMLKPPYIYDDTEEEKMYILHTTKLVRKEQEVIADGFACAYYSSGFVVSFASDDFWVQNTSFTLSVVEDETRKARNHRIFGISHLKQFAEPEFVSWAINNLSLKFRASEIAPEAKRISLRPDHGKQTLQEFSQRIKKESYIVEVVNSLAFDPKAKKKTTIRNNGLIDIRLMDTDNKIGILVRTTAHNELESIYMAADIEKKYL